MKIFFLRLLEIFPMSYKFLIRKIYAIDMIIKVEKIKDGDIPKEYPAVILLRIVTEKRKIKQTNKKIFN